MSPKHSEGFGTSTFKPTTLVDILLWRALHQRDRLAYRFLLDGEAEEVSLTYEELDRQARAIAAQLQSLTTIGDRALLLYPPGLEFITAYFGCLYGGIVAIPAYPPHPARLDRTASKIIAIAHDAKPAVVLTTPSLLAMTKALFVQAPELQTIRWIATDQKDAEEWAEKWQEPAIGRDTLAFLQYTSGATTAPKGVMVSHGNLMHNLALIQRCFEHSSDSQGVIWLPPYHDMGLIGGILQPLYCGCPVTLMSPVVFLQRPIRWLQAISRFRATTSGGPNFAYDLCVRKIKPEQRAGLDLSSWEVAFNGAEPIHPKTLEQFATYFEPGGFRREAFYPCYGLAEATLIVSGGVKAAPPVVQFFQTSALQRNQVARSFENEGTQALVGCGQTRADQQIVIVDPDSLMQCPPDRIGEIWVSGPSVAQGYWNKPGETAHTFHAYLADTAEGPFLRTGDLGFLKDGELFIAGRLKDLIIIDGSNHYPQDLEMSVAACHPAIRPNGCAAFSVDIAGSEHLVVVAELARRLPLNIAEVITAIRRAVAEHHDLRVYDIKLLKAGKIPKTSSGKIQRYVCKTSYLNGTLERI